MHTNAACIARIEAQSTQELPAPTNVQTPSSTRFAATHVDSMSQRLASFRSFSCSRPVQAPRIASRQTACCAKWPKIDVAEAKQLSYEEIDAKVEELQIEAARLKLGRQQAVGKEEVAGYKDMRTDKEREIWTKFEEKGGFEGGPGWDELAQDERLGNPAAIRAIRKNVARYLTARRQKELDEGITQRKSRKLKTKRRLAEGLPAR